MQEKNSQENMIQCLLLWLQALTKMVNDIFSLAVLEMKLAGRSVITMLYFFLLASFLCTVGWIFLMIGLAFWLAVLGIGLIPSFLLVGVLNIFLASIILLSVKKLRQNLNFQATRRRFNKSTGGLDENTLYKKS